MRPGLVVRVLKVLLCTASLGGCGAAVPRIGEIWDDDTGTNAVPVERKIKEKIFCELNDAISTVNNDHSLLIPVSFPDPRHPSRTITKNLKPVPESWGITLTLTLTVEELSALSPGASINTPLIPGNKTFPGNIVSANPQSFALGLGGTLSSDATRFDKYTLFYKVKDLEFLNEGCMKPDQLDGHAPLAFQGSSLLLESDLRIKTWMVKIADLRSSVGVSADNPQQALSYDIKFDIVTSGNVTPTWKLVRVTTPTGTFPFFNAKRERTHEMLLTLGPLASDKNGPGQLAANDALAAQIGAAVGTAVKNALAN